MFTKIHWLHKFDNSARLGIMARPRGNEWLDDEISNLKKQNVQVMVSLLESSEIYELGLQKQSELCSRHGIAFINFPIVDRGIPKVDNNTDQFISQLKNRINGGESIVIHCRMAIGRSAIIAASLLLKTDFPPDDAILHISKIRGVKVPDTEEQVAWLKKRYIKY